jgi:hypothetical protein
MDVLFSDSVLPVIPKLWFCARLIWALKLDRHLNADEWQYIANGTVEIGNFLEDGTTSIDTYNTGAQTACATPECTQVLHVHAMRGHDIAKKLWAPACMIFRSNFVPGRIQRRPQGLPCRRYWTICSR